MSKQIGLIRLKGKIGGVSFYKSGGDDLARVANGPSKQRIDTDPAFVRTRENNVEFGGSAKAAKALRLSLAFILQSMADSRVTSRLTKLFKEINVSDTVGIRGQRSITVSAHRPLLINFEMNKGISFSSVFNAPFTFSNTAARDEGTITIPAFLPQNLIEAPAGATHFRLITSLGVISDYNYNVSNQGYEPTDSALNTLGVIAASVITPISTAAPVNFSLVATLPGAPTMTPTVSVVQCLGIEFYQHIGATDYLLAQDNCMKIVNVF
jgi:hypothetical protein